MPINFVCNWDAIKKTPEMVIELNKKQVCQFLGCKLVMMSFYVGMTDYQAFLRGGEILEGQLEGRRERGKARHKTIQTV